MKRKTSFRTLCQELFLTARFFAQNGLLTHASACAFGFLFSLLPVIIMTATILIRILHASPDILISLFENTNFLPNTINIPHLVNSFLNLKGNGVFYIVISFTLIWMARQLFNSIMKGIRCIFHTEAKHKAIFSQFRSFAGEIILVFFLALIIFFFAATKSLLETSFLLPLIPKFIQNIGETLLNFLPATLMLIIITFSLKIASGTNPKLKHCFFVAIFCTILFTGFRFIFNFVVDTSKYNLIYGVFSTMIILLLEVFTFFSLFLFFAQILFVHQFFDQLLLAELYLLPDKNNTNIFAVLRRIMFIQPDYFERKKTSMFLYKKDNIIFQAEEKTNYVYYVAEGSVVLTKENNITYCDKGGFFGEEACILGHSQEKTAIAETDTKIIKIENETFLAMLEKNPEAHRLALSKIISKIHY